MEADPDNGLTPRQQAAIVHLWLVGVSFFVSVPFLIGGAGLMPGEAIECRLCFLLLVHLFAAAIGLSRRRVTRWSCLTVLTTALLPAGCGAVLRTYDAVHMRYQAPYDRFEDHIARPLPASATNVRFVPWDQCAGNLMIRFDIAPTDLDAILTKLDLKPVPPEQLVNPRDVFRTPTHLPLDGGSQFFQGRDKWGEVLTIKTNDAHTQAIFRKG